MRKKNIISLLVLILVAPLCVAMADTTDTTVTTDCGSAPTAPATGATIQERQQYKQQLQQYNKCKKDQLKSQRQQLAQDRCNLVNQRITDRLNNFQNKQNSDETIFGNVYKRFTNIATRLKNAGLDTTKLTNDLVTLKTKIDKVNTDYVSFIESLKVTADSTCGHSQGEFMGKLGAARGILLSVRQDRLDVKNYILSTIRPDILALRQQLLKLEEKSTTTTNPEIVQ